VAVPGAADGSAAAPALSEEAVGGAPLPAALVVAPRSIGPAPGGAGSSHAAAIAASTGAAYTTSLRAKSRIVMDATLRAPAKPYKNPFSRIALRTIALIRGR
jgi:hypothetical protein